MFDFSSLLTFLKSIFDALMAFFSKIGLNLSSADSEQDNAE